MGIAIPAKTAIAITITQINYTNALNTIFPVVTYQRAKRVMMLIHDDNQSNKFQ